MVTMLALFGKPIDKLSWMELYRERRCQSYFLTRVKYLARDCREAADEGESLRKSFAQMREDKAVFFEMYVQHLEAVIAEIDYWMDRRIEPKSNSGGYHTKAVIRGQNAKRKRAFRNDHNMKMYFARTADGELSVSWDRDRFDLIAADRGYQTEEMILFAMTDELRIDRTKAKLLLDSGRFTWGQVLCLGAFLQMTPREFCDVFLSGYFTEQYGEYRADYENIDRNALLKRAVRSEPTPIAEENEEPIIAEEVEEPEEIENRDEIAKPEEPEEPSIPMEEVFVDSLGKPVGEDTIWFE